MKVLIAVLAGMVTGYALIFGIEALGHSVYPPPADFDYTNAESMKRMMAEAPIGALLFVALAHFLAGFFGNMVALLVAKRRRLPAFIYSGLLLTGTVSLLFMLPHPLWFSVLDLVALLASIIMIFKLFKAPKK